jgi:hypothetical protein
MTGLCASLPHSYSCDANGRRTALQRERSCEKVCQCINISPGPSKPVPCYASNYPYIQQGCWVKADILYDDNGKLLGYLSDATFLPNGTLEYIPTTAEKRDLQLAEQSDYAVVCKNGPITNACIGKPFGYSCTSEFDLEVQGQETEICKDTCFCRNLLQYNGNCILQWSPDKVTIPCKVQEDGIYALNGTVLGYVADIPTRYDGMIDLWAAYGPRRSAPPSAEDTIRANVDELKPRAEVQAATKTTTNPSSLVNLIPRYTATSVTIQDLLLGCLSDHGVASGSRSFDRKLTESCKGQGYYCAIEGPQDWVLSHNRSSVAACDANCVCSGRPSIKPMPHMLPPLKAKQTQSLPVTTKISASATATESNTLHFTALVARDVTGSELYEEKKTRSIPVTSKVTVTAPTSESNTLHFTV